MAFKLPDLPYDYKALEPHIDEQTMRIHHTKHHQGYVDKLNNALEGQDKFLEMSVEALLQNINEVPDKIRQDVINNGGGHANHSLFWQIMAPDPSEPQGNLSDAIDSTFGDLDSFKEKFTQKALGVFGSGWAFLVVKSGKLELTRQSFQNSPYMYDSVPILGVDVWEHAYYLKYQNRRADYIKAWWNVVNWEKVGELFNEASK